MHAITDMTLVCRDYVTDRINGKHRHHKLVYACPICNSEKRYFLNLMPKRKLPRCDGKKQTLHEMFL